LDPNGSVDSPRATEKKGTLDSLVDLAPRIHCCMIFGSDGGLIKTVHARKDSTVEPDRDTDLIFELAAALRRTSRFPNRYHGRIRSVLVLSEETTLIAFPLSDRLVLVTTDPDFPLDRVGELGKLVDRACYWSGEPSAPELEPTVLAKRPGDSRDR
jgi:hypothetical protein